MKKIISILSLGLIISLSNQSCTIDEFADKYKNPIKLSETTIEKQFSGFLFSNKNYIVPEYTNYFVVLRGTLNHYNQVTGWVNGSGQYVPGGAAAQNIWNDYYGTLAQYRELQKVYNSKTAEEQESKKAFMLFAKIYMYDYTQRLTDVFGTIPFTEAGMLSTNGGDYANSLPKFDTAESIYTYMLDDLKTISTELNSIEINDAFLASLKAQDIVNSGDLDLWKRYCNSLRLELLTRASASSTLGSRYTSEVAEILGDPTTYPVVENNDQNIQIEIFDINYIKSNFRQPFNSGSTWYINFAGKAYVDQLTTTNDPRLPVIFTPGVNAEGEYYGIDPMADRGVQADLVGDGMAAEFNESTFDENFYFPGNLINATEVSLFKAEYYLTTGDDEMAKEAYENAISQSIANYEAHRMVSDNTLIPFTAATEEAIEAYKMGDLVSWDMATTENEKLALIAKQKWVHYGIVQPYENWAENRRLDLLGLEFEEDIDNEQSFPPVRFRVSNNETIYNPENYAAIKDQDDYNNKLFWDVN